MKNAKGIKPEFIMQQLRDFIQTDANSLRIAVMYGALKLAATIYREEAQNILINPTEDNYFSFEVGMCIYPELEGRPQFEEWSEPVAKKLTLESVTFHDKDFNITKQSVGNQNG